MEQTILPILIMTNRQVFFFFKEKEEREKKKTKVYAITSLANSSRTGAAGCALASLRYLHYNKEQQQ